MVGKEEARRHRRGEGSTYRVADGGWMAQLSLGTDRRTGKRRTVRRRAPDARGAERALLRLQHEWGIAGEVAWTKLSDYLADWLDAVKPSIAPATFTSYSGHVENHIDPLIGHLPVGSLRPTDVHRLIARLLEQGKSRGHGAAHRHDAADGAGPGRPRWRADRQRRPGQAAEGGPPAQSRP